MTLVILTHATLAIILFFGINLLGQYSPSSFGYYQLTTFLETEEAPGFNFLIRVLTPTVFIIIISAIFYSAGIDRFTKDIYLISVYYVLFRTLFNIAINRIALINWIKFSFYSICIIGLSYFIYKKFILTKSNLLPDFSTMANELWIIIIIFLYNFINNLKPSEEENEKRKERYLRIQFAAINRKYSPIILKQTANTRIRQIALAIIIYENFNRPKLFRVIEYITHFFIRRKHTLGIMQVSSIKFIGDKESVRLGTQKLIKDFKKLKKEYSEDKEGYYSEEYKEDRYQTRLIEQFNPDISYSYEIYSLVDDINTKYFSNGPKELFSKSIAEE